jgi:hypothetical protein
MPNREAIGPQRTPPARGARPGPRAGPRTPSLSRHTASACPRPRRTPPAVRAPSPCRRRGPHPDRSAQGGGASSRQPGSAGAGAGSGGRGGEGDWSGRSAATTQSSASLYFYHRPLSADLAASARPESLRACGGWSLSMSAGRQSRRARSQRDAARCEPPAADLWTAAAGAAALAAAGPPAQRSRSEVQLRR